MDPCRPVGVYAPPWQRATWWDFWIARRKVVNLRLMPDSAVSFPYPHSPSPLSIYSVFHPKWHFISKKKPKEEEGTGRSEPMPESGLVEGNMQTCIFCNPSRVCTDLVLELDGVIFA